MGFGAGGGERGPHGWAGWGGRRSWWAKGVWCSKVFPSRPSERKKKSMGVDSANSQHKREKKMAVSPYGEEKGKKEEKLGITNTMSKGGG